MKKYISQFPNRFYKGFTLIELLVVISIIGILASFLTANFVGVRQRARDSQRKSDLRQIQAALELYRSDNASYPTSAAFTGIACKGQFTGGTITYMNSVPCDPLDGTTKYTYVASPAACAAGACSGYTLSACLENTNDTDAAGASCPNGKTMSVVNP